MRKKLVALTLIVIGIQFAMTRGQIPTSTQEIQTVSFCDLIRHPAEYNGKAVKVSATYALGIEGAIFFDHGCEKPALGSETTANAEFRGKDKGTTQAFGKLMKFLRQNRISTAQVTIIATFTNLEPVVIAGRSRLTLNVKQLLAVEKTNSSEAQP